MKVTEGESCSNQGHKVLTLVDEVDGRTISRDGRSGPRDGRPGYFQGGGSPQRSQDVVALVGSRLVGPNLPRG